MTDIAHRSPWFASLRRRLARAAGRPVVAPRGAVASSPGLRLERLEDRWQPSVVIGIGAELRDAATDARENDANDSGYVSGPEGDGSRLERWLLLAEHWDGAGGDRLWPNGPDKDGLNNAAGGLRDNFPNGGPGAGIGNGNGIGGGNLGGGNVVGSEGGYVDPADGPGDLGTPLISAEATGTTKGAVTTSPAFGPAISPDTRFRGGRDVLSAQPSGLAYGGGFTLGFSREGAPDSATPILTNSAEAVSPKLEAEPISDDSPESADRPAVPLRAAAGVSQAFELSGASGEVRDEVWEDSETPLEQAALESATLAPSEPEGAPEQGQTEPEPEVDADVDDAVEGFVWIESSAGEAGGAGYASASEAFWAAVGEDDDSCGGEVDPAATCFFERNECVLQRTSSAVAVAALVGLLHRGWKRRQKRTADRA
ncbi:MAG TPA: hypothetical protein VGE52_22070 [Pirellulales bacterium]